MSRSMSKFLINKSRKSPFFKIFGNSYKSKDGSAIRDYVHVMDVVDAHIVALKKIDKFSGHNIYNVGTGKGRSVKELLNSSFF